MITCIFTIDYEIYGNGDGSLRELVLVPAERLRTIFRKKGARFVAFIEAAELEMIDEKQTDPAIGMVREQIKRFHAEGFELGLHIHPQWYNARYENGRWTLDYNEYNLCTLPRERIAEIVDRSLGYLRVVVEEPHFTPLAFRAGNWLFQPSEVASSVLADAGIKIDSSVFKGGVQRRHGLDYRRALANGFYWNFSSHVDIADSNGALLEIPTHTRMVPFWKMLTTKRVGIKRKRAPYRPSTHQVRESSIHRVLDFIRFWYPQKLDYCRMSLDELISMVDAVIREDQAGPAVFRPIVAIGHTKDLFDYETVEAFLSYLKAMRIPISTFGEVHKRWELGKDSRLDGMGSVKATWSA